MGEYLGLVQSPFLPRCLPSIMPVGTFSTLGAQLRLRSPERGRPIPGLVLHEIREWLGSVQRLFRLARARDWYLFATGGDADK
jgi:hypothetical protein